MLTLNRNKKRKANPIQQDDTVAKKPAVRRFFSFRSPTPFGNLFIFCLPRILPHRLGSEQALAPVRLPDTFAEGAWDKVPKTKGTFDFVSSNHNCT